MNAYDRGRSTISWRFEWKPEDMWIGTFWRCAESPIAPNFCGFRKQVDVWICFVPCLPLHLWWLSERHLSSDGPPYRPEGTR